MKRELGEVWRSDFTSPKPWKVQGFGAVASYSKKKHAKAVGELFKTQRDRDNERTEITSATNPRTDSTIYRNEFAD